MKLTRLISLVDLQARTALQAEASRLYLSYLWWVLEPLLFVAVFYVVFEFLLARGKEDFVFFLMCGKVPYLWISKSITISGNSLLNNRGLIGSIDIPKIVFPYISLQEVLYKQWVVFMVLFLMAFYYGSYPTLEWLWLIPIVVTNYIMLVALSLIGALLVTYAQDFRIIINMGLMFLMFASGIFWDINDIQSEYWRNIILTWNPLAYLIDCYRAILMYNTSYDIYHMAAVAGVFLTLTLFLHLVYRGMNSRLTLQVLQS
ncbi:MAG: ABC transporter permease [Pseudomonadota bacterium]